MRKCPHNGIAAKCSIAPPKSQFSTTTVCGCVDWNGNCNKEEN